MDQQKLDNLRLAVADAGGAPFVCIKTADLTALLRAAAGEPELPEADPDEDV